MLVFFATSCFPCLEDSIRLDFLVSTRPLGEVDFCLVKMIITNSLS